MTVKEIIEKSAELLGVELTDENTENFVRCYNLVESELATDYFPILEVEKFFHVKDKIYYKDFSKNPYMLKGIQNFNGNSVCFRLAPEYINLIKNYGGVTFFVKYYYIPEEKTIEEKCDYDCMYEQVFKYGICEEYCLMKGDYETASSFIEKYKKAIQEIYANRKRGDNGD